MENTFLYIVWVKIKIQILASECWLKIYGYFGLLLQFELMQIIRTSRKVSEFPISFSIVNALKVLLA